MTLRRHDGGHVVQQAVVRAGIDPAEVEDVMMGCALSEGTTGATSRRQIALRAAFPCDGGVTGQLASASSGLQTIAMAAQRVMTEKVPVIVAGGLDSISCVQTSEHAHAPDPLAPRAQARDLLEHGPDGRRRSQNITESLASGRMNMERAASSARRKLVPPASSDDEIVPMR